MNTDILLSLVSLMLPTDMLTAFNVVKVENDSQRIAIHLDEKIPDAISLQSSIDYISIPIDYSNESIGNKK